MLVGCKLNSAEGALDMATIEIDFLEIFVVILMEPSY
jgi:hypothetical protein